METGVLWRKDRKWRSTVRGASPSLEVRESVEGQGVSLAGMGGWKQRMWP